MTINRKSVLYVSVLLSLVGVLVAWYWYWTPQKAALVDQRHRGGNIQNGMPSSVIPVTDFDAFQKDLASRVADKFGIQVGSVVIAPAAYDLGWLLDSVETYPADRIDCVPAPQPTAIPAPHLFPSYQLSSTIAATMTLGSDAFQKIESASLELTHQSKLVYSIDQVQVLLMDLRTVDRLSQTGACALCI